MTSTIMAQVSDSRNTSTQNHPCKDSSCPCHRSYVSLPLGLSFEPLLPLVEQEEHLSSAEAYDLLSEIAVDVRAPEYEAWTGTNRRRNDDYWAQWGSVLPKLGFRLFEYAQERGLRPPTEELLRTVFAMVLMREADPLSRLTDVDRWARARSSAAFTVQEWDPGYKARKREEGRRGGRKSKPPFKYGPEALEGLHGLSIPEQARRLGVSVSTISRLRRLSPLY